MRHTICLLIRWMRRQSYRLMHRQVRIKIEPVKLRWVGQEWVNRTKGGQ